MNEPMKIGDRGRDVRLWQNLLLADGWDLGHWGADGIFGKMTHNATVGAERSRTMAPTGTVYPMLVQAMLLRRQSPQPAPSFNEFQIKWKTARNFTKTQGRLVTKIVLHTIEIAEASTSAERTADWFAGEHAPRASAHFCVDDDSVIQCVPDVHVAWHAPGANHNGIGIEQAGYARQTAEQWLDPYSRRMLERVSWLVALKSVQHRLPLVALDVPAMQRDEPGVTTHDVVSRAFGKSDHWDPGPNYPMDHVLTRARHWRERIQSEGYNQP